MFIVAPNFCDQGHSREQSFGLLFERRGIGVLVSQVSRYPAAAILNKRHPLRLAQLGIVPGCLEFRLRRIVDFCFEKLQSWYVVLGNDAQVNRRL